MFALAFVILDAKAHAADKAACAAAAEAGQRLFKDHKLTEAREKLLVCSSTDCPDIISKDCTQWLGEVERNVASVVIKARDEQGQPITDLRVTVDGTVLTEHSSDAPIEMDPGTHALRFEHDGFDPVQQNMPIAEGKRGQELAVVMHPPKAAPPPPVAPETKSGTPLLVTSIALAGVGVVGMGLFAGFGLAGLSQQNDMKAPGGCAPNCTGTPELASLNTKFTVANASLVGGLVGLGVGAALFVVWMVTHPHAKETTGLRGLQLVF
jgi:hypothetical protein